MTEADANLKAAVRQTVKTESQYRYRQIVWTVVPALVITAAIIAVLAGEALHMATRVDNNQNSIRAEQQQMKANEIRIQSTLDIATDALIAARNAEYRICLRQIITRAAVNTIPGMKRLPLYNCTPNLNGQAAQRLNAKQARTLERHVAATPTDQLP